MSIEKPTLVKNLPFTAIPNDLLKDKNFKGPEALLLMRLLSKPDGWNVIPKALAKEYGTKTRTIQYNLKRLRELGYVRLKQVRSPDMKRILKWEYHVSYKPEFLMDSLGAKNVLVEKSTNTKFAHLINKDDIIKNTQNNIPPIISPEGGESDGALKDEEGLTEKPSNETSTKESFEAFWEIYPRKIGKENAYKQFEANLRKKHNFKEMQNSAKLYSAYCQQRQLEPSYIKNPVAFLKNIWNDEGSLKEWALSLGKPEESKIPFSRMPSDAAQRLRKLIATKQLLDENGNPITERTGFVEEFLNSGFWGALPGFVQKAIVEFQSDVETKSNAVPEPIGWREHLEQNYDAENEKIQKYILKGWKSIPEWLQRDIVFEMGSSAKG